MPVRAVVMAGGEGTRLRPLTSNQPKPMVPVVGKPCMEYIIELLERHGVGEAVVTLAFLPAHHPRLLRRRLDARRAHALLGRARARPARPAASSSPRTTCATRPSSSSRVTPSPTSTCRTSSPSTSAAAPWSPSPSSTSRTRSSSASSSSTTRGASSASSRSPRGDRCSRTRSTPASTCSSRRCSTTSRRTTPFDFSQELFPKLFEMGAPLYGYVADGYWQDIGSLQQYLSANRDVLDGKVEATDPGHRAREARLHRREHQPRLARERHRVRRSSATTPRSHPRAHVGAYSVLGSNVVRQGARRDPAQRDRRQHLRRRLEQGPGHDRRQELRHQVGRHAQRGRGARRRVRDRRGAYDRARRQGLSVQERRVGRPDQLEHHLGVARHVAALRQGRGRRPHQHRHHRRARAQAGDGLRDDTAEGRPRDHEPRRTSRRRGSSSGRSSAASTPPASWSATCAWRAARSPASRSRTAARRAACTCASRPGTPRWCRSRSSSRRA